MESKDSFPADLFSSTLLQSHVWNTGHTPDGDHFYILIFLSSVTEDVPARASQLVSGCCFYQDVNTWGRHSMTCTLWMGWQVIDSVKMEKRWSGWWWWEGEGEGGEQGEELEMSVLMCEAGLSFHRRIVQRHCDVSCRWAMRSRCTVWVELNEGH